MKKLIALFFSVMVLLSGCLSSPTQNLANVTPSQTVPGDIDPEYAANLIYINLKEYGTFSDIDPNIMSQFDDAFKGFTDNVIGKSSASGVEVYIIVGKSSLDSKDIHDKIQSIAQKRANLLKKCLWIRCINKLGAVIFADSDDECKQIGGICDAVFIGQIH